MTSHLWLVVGKTLKSTRAPIVTSSCTTHRIYIVSSTSSFFFASFYLLLFFFHRVHCHRKRPMTRRIERQSNQSQPPPFFFFLSILPRGNDGHNIGLVYYFLFRQCFISKPIVWCWSHSNNGRVLRSSLSSFAFFLYYSSFGCCSSFLFLFRY